MAAAKRVTEIEHRGLIRLSRRQRAVLAYIGKHPGRTRAQVIRALEEYDEGAGGRGFFYSTIKRLEARGLIEDWMSGRRNNSFLVLPGWTPNE